MTDLKAKKCRSTEELTERTDRDKQGMSMTAQTLTPSEPEVNPAMTPTPPAVPSAADDAPGGPAGSGVAIPGETPAGPLVKAAVYAAPLVALFVTGRYNYPLYHTLAEMFSIVIAFGIFMMAWSARRFTENGFLLFLGIAYCGVGTLDTAHTLTYKGIGIFPHLDADIPTQLWIAARYVESLSLVAAPAFIDRKAPLAALAAGYAVAVGLLLTAILGPGWFPACYVEGAGLTPFKVASEYTVCALIVAAMVRTYRRRARLGHTFYRLMTVSLVLTILAELNFTLYADVYGLSNLVGHYFKIGSFYFLYKGVIETGLSKPYELLFSSLTSRENALREKNEALSREIDRRSRISAQLKGINQELSSAKAAAESHLREAQQRNNALVRKMSEMSLKKADAAQLHARLTRSVQDLRENNDLLREQIGRYIRMFEQTHEDIDQIVVGEK